MLTSQEYRDKTVSPELGTQNKPQVTVVAEKAAPSYESTLVTEAMAAAQFRFRILVVDDEPSIREAVREMLESGGYEVLTAVDGLDGLHALSKSLPDLIISDLNMPRMSGFEFLAVVRERFPAHRDHCCQRRVHRKRKSARDFGGRVLAKRPLHFQGALPRNHEAFGCFSDPLGKAEE